MGTVHAKEARTATLVASEDGENEQQKTVSLSEIPAKVRRVHFDGLGRTKDDIIAKQVQDLFKANTFEDVVKKATLARMKMEKLGLFKKISVFIDTAKGESAKPNGYDVFFEVKETRRVTGSVSTQVGTNEGSMLFTVRMPNTLGRAEKVAAEYTYGTKHAVGNTLILSKPISGNPNYQFSTGLYKFSGEYPWSLYRELDKGVNVDFSFPSLFGSHNLRWDGVWRELNCMPGAAFAVREEAGHSLKSAVKHTWVRDRRDDRILPNNGYYIKHMVEVAGLGGDTSFVKNDAEFQLNKSFIWDSVLQLSLAGGTMKSLHPGGNIKLLDRFFLGGPLTLRGFDIKGAGPNTEGCSLGGDTYWLAGLHLYTPLPFRPGRGGFGDLFRTHFFVNAGNIGNLDLTDNWAENRDNIQRLADNVRVAYGAGVVLKMGGIARMELNYCWPYRFLAGDAVRPGVQFGIGISFL